VWAIEHFHHFLELLPFEVVTDHSALKWLQTFKLPKGRRARWMMKLQQYNFNIRHRPGKLNDNADALSRMYEQEEGQIECFMMEFENTVEDTEEMEGIEYNDDWGINEHWTSDKEEPTSQDIRPKICLTCGHRNGSKTWNKKHYYSYARENDYQPWICGYQNEPAKIIELEAYNTDEDGPSYFTVTRQTNEKVSPQRNDYRYGLSETSEEESIKFILSNEESEILDFGAFSCTREEYENLFKENIRERHVVANQPIRRGGSKCTDACDTENHHTHFYCRMCKRNLPYGQIEHDCLMGFDDGKIRPDMRPEWLINTPWWPEPFLVQIEAYILNPVYEQYLKSIYYDIPIIQTLAEELIPALD
jgi:hypothetical protein